MHKSYHGLVTSVLKAWSALEKIFGIVGFRCDLVHVECNNSEKIIIWWIKISCSTFWAISLGCTRSWWYSYLVMWWSNIKRTLYQHSVLFHYQYPGAVLEILLSSFQTACLLRTFAMRVQWDFYAEFPVTLQHKFLRRSPILLCGDKKMQIKVFLNFELKTKASNTAIQPAVYALWNLVTEKGCTHHQGKILSGFWKPQKPL